MKNTAAKKSKLILFTLLASVFVTGNAFRSADPDPTSVVRMAEEKLKGKTSVAELTIKVIRPKWERDMSVKSWTKGDSLALILVTAPAKDKGTVTLKRDKEVWSWVPSIERTIKLPPSMMSQSWMGTDFTNDDLVKQSSAVNDYTHAFGKDSTLQSRDCYRVIMTPKPNAAVVWGKVIVFIDKKDYLELRTEFYDEDGTLVDIMNCSDIKMLGGKLLPGTMEMIPVDKPGQKTVLVYSSMQFDAPLDDNFFTVVNMQTVK